METLDAKALLVGAKLKIIDNPEMREAFNLAIDALLKQIPVKAKKYLENANGDYGCPVCGNVGRLNYCSNCGQKLYY